MIEFAVPAPPSANAIWKKWRGRMVLSNEYRDWRSRSAWLVKTLRLETFDGPVRADYILPNKSRLDIDNSCKPLGDLLQTSGILTNDKQIRQLWIDHQDRADVLVRVQKITREES